jgi:hypothetical protein
MVNLLVSRAADHGFLYLKVIALSLGTFTRHDFIFDFKTSPHLTSLKKYFSDWCDGENVLAVPVNTKRAASCLNNAPVYILQTKSQILFA